MNAGIEGYGWGALSIHLLIRHILGLCEEEVGVLTVAPMLPIALRRVGAVYRIAPLPWGAYALSMECRVKDEEGYMVSLRWSGKEEQWEGTWGEARVFKLA